MPQSKFKRKLQFKAAYKEQAIRPAVVAAVIQHLVANCLLWRQWGEQCSEHLKMHGLSGAYIREAVYDDQGAASDDGHDGSMPSSAESDSDMEDAQSQMLTILPICNIL